MERVTSEIRKERDDLINKMQETLANNLEKIKNR